MIHSHFHFAMHSNQCPIRDHIFVFLQNHVLSIRCKNEWNAHFVTLVGLSVPQYCEVTLWIWEITEQNLGRCWVL